MKSIIVSKNKNEEKILSVQIGKFMQAPTQSPEVVNIQAMMMEGVNETIIQNRQSGFSEDKFISPQFSVIKKLWMCS